MRAGICPCAAWGSSDRCRRPWWPGFLAGSRAGRHCARGAQRRARQQPPARSAAAGRGGQTQGSVPWLCCHRVAAPVLRRQNPFWAWFDWSEVLLELGKRACPPLATPAIEPCARAARSTPATPGLRSPGIYTTPGDAS